VKRWAAIARMGGVGDNLVAGSPLRALKRQGYMTEVLSSEPNHVVFHNNPWVDKLTVKNVERDIANNDLGRWQEWMRGRSKEYDIFVHASHSMEGRHAVFPVMTSFWWPEEVRREICSGSYLETAHKIAGVPFDFGPLYFPTDEEKRLARQVTSIIGDRYICWVLSGTRIDKVYSYAPYAIARIVKELNAPVLCVGGPSEKERSMGTAIVENVELQNGGREGVHIAVPPDGSESWPLRTSLALVHGASLVVSPDTGPAWAVALEPTAKVIMVSHASAENITKHWVNTTTLHADPNRVPCWPCHRLHDDISTCVKNKEGKGAACISDISVERVVQAVAEKWRGAQVLPMVRPTGPGSYQTVAGGGR